VGVAGINWVSKIQAVRVLGKCGGFTSDIVDGIRWAAGLYVSGASVNSTPSRVINMSLGGSGACSTAQQKAINEAVAVGTVVVVAAGNSNADAANFSPGNCTGVITVASNDRDGNRAYYSNYGTSVEITAPGGETVPTGSNGVLSTLNLGTTSPGTHGYAYYQGTSMATPHVAGVVSLMLSKNPYLTPAQVTNLLQANVTAFPLGSTCTTSICGAGILNAAAVLQAVANPPVFTQKLFLPTINNNYCLGLQNSGFESGGNCWIQYSRQNYPAIYNSGFPTGIAPRSGSYAAWLGGDNEELIYIQQIVRVNSGTPYLYYYHWIDSTDDPGYDFGYVRVNGTAVDTINLATSTNTNGWVKRTVNLSAYADQNVVLEFNVITDGSLDSSWYIDDVGFQATP
jgi:serine protease